VSSCRVLAVFGFLAARATGPCVAAAAITLLAAPAALANGRFPASNQIVFSPTNENIIVGRATWAILPSTDNGKTWGYLCEEALALPNAVSFEDPELGLTYTNALVAGLDTPTVGLDVSNDLGCNWNCIGGPLAHQAIADIVVRPDSLPDASAPHAGSTSHQVLALIDTFGTTSDAGTLSQVFQSLDDGATWGELGTLIDGTDATLAVATIDVTANDPTRFYVSGTRGYGPGKTASLFVSSDSGTSWTEYPVHGFDPTLENQIFIGGVDPDDEDRVYLRSTSLPGAGGASRLYVYGVTDGGPAIHLVKSFTIPPPMNSENALTGELLGFALSPDDSTVYVGTIESGLWRASKADLTFTQVNPKVHVQCLAARQTTTGPELWACADEATGFIFGKSTDDGVTFKPLMTTITSTSGLVACTASGQTSAACFTDANASACSCSGYQNYCSTIEIVNACLGCGQDGAPPPARARCGCSVVGGGGAAGFVAGCSIMAIALRRRRASTASQRRS
jgi:hypothetical protein